MQLPHCSAAIPTVLQQAKGITDPSVVSLNLPPLPLLPLPNRHERIVTIDGCDVLSLLRSGFMDLRTFESKKVQDLTLILMFVVS